MESKITYDYPATGDSMETVATLPDGRQMAVIPSYSAVLPLGEHASICSQLTKMGGRCDCGKLDGVDVAALVADARLHGKYGWPPRPAPTAEDARLLAEYEARERKLCPHCHTMCYGDCQAN